MFEREIAFFESKLKNPYDVGTIVPPPLIPPILTNVNTPIVPIIPQNS
jgi:phospholipid N-methyltransferase